MSLLAVRREEAQELSPNESPSHYSEEQLQSLYSDLFSSLPSMAQVQSTTVAEALPSLQTLQERFNITNHVPHRALVDHLQAAVEYSAGVDMQLGLVLDSEWEVIIRSALDAGDLEYALKGLDVMKTCKAGLIENLDLRLLDHPLAQNVDDFSHINDKLTEVGYPNTPERLSLFINSHLHSHPHGQPPMPQIRDTQDLIHKLEAQGTPPSQMAYISVMRAYLDISRDSSVLSNTSTNPSAAIAAIHDLFAHMRYVAHPNPSLEAYSLVLFACARGNRADPLRALELMQEVKQGLLANRADSVDIRSLVACYNGAIRACARTESRFIGDAFRLAKELVQPDGIPVAGTALGAIGPDRQTMAALMHAAKRTGDIARARWILTEAMRAQAQISQGEIILDEEIMTCAFQAYSAFSPPFSREMTREASAPEASSGATSKAMAESSTKELAQDSSDSGTQRAYPLPQSASEVLVEVNTLFLRIISKRSTTPDPVFVHVPISPRIVNAYLGVYFSHAPLEQALARFSEVSGLVQPNAYTFVNLFERLARAGKPERHISERMAATTWPHWQDWIGRVETGKVDPILAEATPRAIERAWAAIIRVHSLCDNIDTSLALLREFVTKYPPSSLKHEHPSPVPTLRSRLEYPATSNKSLSALLATPAPRVGLLVRLTTPEQITEPGIGPHLLFADLALLHQRLVSRHSHRKADIAFVSWACKSYELQLKRRREQTLGVAKPPHTERGPLDKGKTSGSRR